MRETHIRTCEECTGVQYINLKNIHLLENNDGLSWWLKWLRIHLQGETWI